MLKTAHWLSCLMLAANPGLAQNFTELTKGIEISFPENKTPISFPPALGTPIPTPKVMETEPGFITLSNDGKLDCAIIIAKNASVTEKSAARELADQIAFLAGSDNAPEITADGGGVSASAVFSLGVDTDFKDGEVKSPSRHEGFTIKTGVSKGKNTVFVAGRDRFGVYWGAQTLRQMLIKEGPAPWFTNIYNDNTLKVLGIKDKTTVLMPRGTVMDWPDAQYRLAHNLEYRIAPGAPLEALSEAVRFGRVNATAVDLMNSAGKGPRTQESIKSRIEELHKHGVICLGVLYWLEIEHYFERTQNRGFCPLRDMDFLRTVVRDAFDAGADGVETQFDDLLPNHLTHFRDCPLCREKFKNIAQPQVYVLQNLLSFAERINCGSGRKLFTACPSLYCESLRLHYKRYMGLKPEDYYPEFFCFPEAGKIRFYYCDATREELDYLKSFGIKNPVWWNNGPYDGSHPLSWNYLVALAGMKRSMGMYNGMLPNTGDEIFFPERVREIKSLKGGTDLINSHTGDCLGHIIGGVFAWDMEHFPEREQELTEFFVNNHCGADVIGAYRAWEWAAQKLAAKCIKGQPYEQDDTKYFEAARAACSIISRLRRPLYGSCSTMEHAMKTFEAANGFLSKMKTGPEIEKQLSLSREDGCLFSLTPASLLKDAQVKPGGCRLTVEGEPMRLAADNGQAGFLLSKNKLTATDKSFVLSQKSFTVDAKFTMLKDTLWRIAGTRATLAFSSNSKGNPGWALGVGYGGEICLTTEGLDEVIACASGGKTSCFLPTHVIAVRDFKLRKLYIYINGRKTAEADETGSGEFPPKTSTLSVSYETWSVQYMSGLLNSVKIYERAFSDDEIKQCFSK